MLLRLFIAALWSLAGKGLTSWLLLVMFIFFLLSNVVSLVRCGSWLYRLLIFVVFLTFTQMIYVSKLEESGHVHIFSKFL